jgi:hypothetical protein
VPDLDWASRQRTPLLNQALQCRHQDLGHLRVRVRPVALSRPLPGRADQSGVEREDQARQGLRPDPASRPGGGRTTCMYNKCNDHSVDHGPAMLDRRKFLVAGLGPAAAALVTHAVTVAPASCPYRQML